MTNRNNPIVAVGSTTPMGPLVSTPPAIAAYTNSHEPQLGSKVVCPAQGVLRSFGSPERGRALAVPATNTSTASVEKNTKNASGVAARAMTQ